jgi:signal transduction histidine kinase
MDSLQQAFDALASVPARLLAAGVTTEQLAALDALRRGVDPSSAVVDPIALADREDAIGTWLEERDVSNAWDLAATLASVGADVPWCERVASSLDEPALDAGFAWLAATLSSTALLAEIRDANRRISDLVTVMREHSQVDRASLQVIDVTAGIESTLMLLAHKVRDAVTVERDFEHGSTRIEADPGALNQVWMNLIDNAVDAMDGSGTLRLATRVEGETIVVEIGDTGAGMPPAVQDRAFEPFFTTKDVGKGTGLGLDITRQIVDHHHGEIEIESEPGNTVLRVRLPLHQP